LGGDSDTIACIAGAIAEARFGCIPERIKAETLSRLTVPLRTLTTRFTQRFG
jgi:ADP-ribosylglycohydrolase